LDAALLVIGGLLALVGLLGLIRARFLDVRRRLMPAASIRGRGFGGASVSYQTGSGYSLWRGLSMLLLATGGAIIAAAIATQ
jgi:hypothetical protein